MKTKILLTVFIISFAGLFAQQKEGAKLQKADESGFIEVDKAPALISQLKPEYPKLAKLAGIEGTVFLKLLIDEKGNVAKAKVEKGVKDMLDESALKAAKEAKFSPAMLKDKPVKVWVVLPVAFKLSVDKEEPKSLGQGIKAPSNISSEDPDPSVMIPYEKSPEAVEFAKPAYPEIAKRAGITGKVFVKLLVDKEGIPKKAIVVKSESELFNQSAIDAAMKSKFTPALQDGKPIAVWIVLPYKFALGDKKDESLKVKSYTFMSIIAENVKDDSYPKEAIAMKLEGTVVVRVFFDESSGQFQKAEIVESANEILDNAAKDYVQKSLPSLLEFQSQMLKDGKTKMTDEQKFVSGSLVTVEFSLKDKVKENK